MVEQSESFYQVNGLCLTLLSWPLLFLFFFFVLTQDCVHNMLTYLLLVCYSPNICNERLQRKGKSEMGILQIDWAEGQSEEAHTEL